MAWQFWATGDPEIYLDLLKQKGQNGSWLDDPFLTAIIQWRQTSIGAPDPAAESYLTISAAGFTTMDPPETIAAILAFFRHLQPGGTVARDLSALLISMQNPDGSWGNGPASTAWAIWALGAGDNATRAGLRYLTKSQNADGGWGESEAGGSRVETTAVVFHALADVEPSNAALQSVLEYLWRNAADQTCWYQVGGAVSLTSEALRALILSGVSDVKVNRGLGWIFATKPEATSELASQIAVSRFTDMRAESSLQELLLRQKADGGFGSAKDDTSNVVDTALTLQALSLEAIDPEVRRKGREYLLNLQANDGSWTLPKINSVNAKYYITSLAILALVQEPQAEAAVQQAAVWLIAQRNQDYGWGAGGSSPWLTALAYSACVRSGVGLDAGDETRSFLLQAQLAAGSWQDSAWATATILRVLGETELNLSFADGLVSEPTEIVAGQSTKLKVTVVNHSGMTVRSAPVIFVEEKPEGYVALGEPVIIPVLRAGERVAVDFPGWTPNVGRYKLAAIIDPQGTLGEQNNLDNLVEAEFYAAPASAADLYMLEDGLTLTPAVPIDGEVVTLKARIRNRGTEPADSVVVRFFDGAAQIGQDQTVPQIKPAESAYLTVEWVAREGVHVLKVEMDPENAIPELDEANNFLCKQVPVSLVRPPSAPEGLSASAEDAAVSLFWCANPEPDIAGYHVYRDGLRINAQSILNTEFYDDSLINGRVYTYTVTAVNTNNLESEPSAPVAVMPVQGLLSLPYFVYPGSSHRTTVNRQSQVQTLGMAGTNDSVCIDYGAGRTKTVQALTNRTIILAATDGTSYREHVTHNADGDGMVLPLHRTAWDLSYEANELPMVHNPAFTASGSGSFSEATEGGYLTVSTVGGSSQRTYERPLAATVGECSVEWRISPTQLGTGGLAMVELRNGSYGATVHIYQGGLSVFGASETKLPLPTYNQQHTYQLTLRNRRAYLYLDGQSAGAFPALNTTDRVLRFGCKGNIQAAWDSVRFISAVRRPLPREGFVRWRTLDFRCPVSLDDLDWDATPGTVFYSFTGKPRNLAASTTYKYEINPANLSADPSQTVLRDGQAGGSATYMNWNGTDGQILFDLGSPCYLQSVRCWVKGGTASIKAPDKVEVYTSADGLVYQRQGISKDLPDLAGQWIEIKTEVTWTRFVRVILRLRSGSINLNEVELLGGNWTQINKGQSLGAEPATFCARITRQDDLTTPVCRWIACAAHAPIDKGIFLTTLDGIAEGRTNLRATILTQAQTPSTSMEILADYTPPVIALTCPAKGTAGQPYSFDAARSFDGTGVADIRWVFDDGTTSAGDLTLAHVFPFIGSFITRATLFDQAGNSSTLERTVEMTEEAPRVSCVLWHGKEQAHPTWSGKAVTLKGVCKGFSGTITYRWDFGDGQSQSGTVTNVYGISATHTYTGAVGTPIQAVLTVTDTKGHSASDRYDLVMMGRTPQVERDVAIDEALWWIHKNQTRDTYAAGVYQPYAVPYGYWTEGTSYTITPTSASIEAFENNGYLPLGNPEEDPYVETVRRGLAYLMNKIKQVSIAPQTAGDPDTNHNGYGLDVDSPRSMYEIGMIMMAVVGSQSPNLVAETGPATYVRGRTYKQILQDMVDFCAFAQTDPNAGSYRGGWRYYANSGDSDNSVTQWPAIGLAAAETSPWNITAPQFVKNELALWLKYSQNAGGGFGYTGPNDWINPAKTGAGLACLAYVGKTLNDQAVQKALSYLNQYWVKVDGGQDALFGNLYAMYAVMKGFRLFKPTVERIGEHDWMWDQGRSNAYPHELILDVGSVCHIAQVVYTPRQDSASGRVKNYEVYASADGQNWGQPVAKGTFVSGTTDISLPVDAVGRYLRFRGLSEVNGNPWMAVAEIKVFYDYAGDSPPRAPVGVCVLPTAARSLTVYWSDLADNEMGYLIERRQGSTDTWAEVAATGPNVRSFADTSLTPETTYTYRITAVNDKGSSAPVESSGTTMTALNEVVGTGAPITTWADSNTDNAKFAVDGNPQTVWQSSGTAGAHEIILDLGAVYTLAGLRYLAAPGGGRIKNYEIYVSDSVTAWGNPVSAGVFQDTDSWQYTAFSATNGRFIRIRGLSSYNGSPDMRVAELLMLFTPARSPSIIQDALRMDTVEPGSIQLFWSLP